jgi:hypothetical protein
MVNVELTVGEIVGLYISLIHYKEYVEDGPRDESYERLIKELDAMIAKLDTVLAENSK